MRTKKGIISKNLNLPPHEIKKIVKQYFPDITTDEIEKLITEILEEKRIVNFENAIISKDYQNFKKTYYKHEDDEYER